jgi:uncharacterized UBP type Zn finger protein
LKSLTELAAQYQTDKQVINHNYMPMYEFWLKDRKIDSLLEIGFGPGLSMKMWLDYYPDSKIYCMDNMGDEFEKVWHNPDTNISGLNMVKGDSTNPEAWLNVPYNLDVIIDDGSHAPNDQIATFMLGFSKLKSRGLYFIEDTHCNFEKIYSDKDIIYPWLNGLIVNQQCPSYATEGDFYRFRGLMSWPSRDILSYHLYKSIILFEKA